MAGSLRVAAPVLLLTPDPPDYCIGAGAVSASPGRGRREFQRHAVHAIAQAGRLRAVVEDVAEMAAAAMARDRSPRHAERAVGRFVDRLVERRPKARPAGAAFEFGLRREQRKVAAGTGERAVAMLLEQFAGERPLGAFLAQHVVLGRRQKLVPLLVGVGDFVSGRCLRGVGAG
jgi:hypothetical protein